MHRTFPALPIVHHLLGIWPQFWPHPSRSDAMNDTKQAEKQRKKKPHRFLSELRTAGRQAPLTRARLREAVLTTSALSHCHLHRDGAQTATDALNMSDLEVIVLLTERIRKRQRKQAVDSADWLLFDMIYALYRSWSDNQGRATVRPPPPIRPTTVSWGTSSLDGEAGRRSTALQPLIARRQAAVEPEALELVARHADRWALSNADIRARGGAKKAAIDAANAITGRGLNSSYFSGSGARRRRQQSAAAAPADGETGRYFGAPAQGADQLPRFVLETFGWPLASYAVAGSLGAVRCERATRGQHDDAGGAAPEAVHGWLPRHVAVPVTTTAALLQARRQQAGAVQAAIECAVVARINGLAAHTDVLSQLVQEAVTEEASFQALRRLWLMLPPQHRSSALHAAIEQSAARTGQAVAWKPTTTTVPDTATPAPATANYRWAHWPVAPAADGADLDALSAVPRFVQVPAHWPAVACEVPTLVQG